MGDPDAMSAGAALSARFFELAVRPILDEVLDGAGYLAARLGSGSDVLGYDDALSTDHDFGCRLTVLVDDEHQPRLALIDEALQRRLPDEVDGWPTRFATTWDGAVDHKVDLGTVHGFATSRLGFDLRTPLRPAVWLCLTGQSVLEVTGGPVFHDTTRSYAEIARQLAWYPDDVWRSVLAAGWARLGEELPLVGRTGHRGDDPGSRMVAARLCRDLTHLAFTAERVWMPYPKWAGTALRALPDGPAASDHIAAIQTAGGWEGRQERLREAIEHLARRHRRAGFDLPAPAVVGFHERPFLAVNEQIAASLADGIADEALRAAPLIGSIEQWCDSVRLLTRPHHRARAVAMYGGTS